jgi:A1 cistron-splicing factor AAR2
MAHNSSLPPPTGILALLNLPTGSLVCLDGVSVALKTNDFVGFSSVPLDSFHLVTARASQRGNNNAVGVTVGFVLFFQITQNDGSIQNFVCRYDNLTEELSTDAVDELTQTNLLNQVRKQQLEPHRLVPYNQLVTDSKLDTWTKMTSFITESYLGRRHRLQSGEKVVPSTLDEDDDSLLPSHLPQHQQQQHQYTSQLSANQTPIVDGRSLSFPSIPIFAPTNSRRRTQHVGTKRFLSRLSPTQRTLLFQNLGDSLDIVLQSIYDSNWKDLLGDLQLSFLLFVQLHCFASLTVWRDLIVLLSSCSKPKHPDSMDLYQHVLETVLCQLKSLNDDGNNDLCNHDDDDDDGLWDPSFVKALYRLVDNLQTVPFLEHSSSQRKQLHHLIISRWPVLEWDDAIDGVGDNKDTMMQDGENDDDDDDDPPVVVSSEEMEASFLRQKTERSPSVVVSAEDSLQQQLQKRFPLLTATRQLTLLQEDWVMTCARVLQFSNDVSLVREAADYLETVEASSSSSSSSTAAWMDDNK